MDVSRSPISAYGLIGNCRTAALVSNRGSIDWCCWPNFDSPAVFAALLDPGKGGFFRVSPAGSFRSRQRYLIDTNVLETVFETDGGRLRLIDCFPVREEAEERRELWPDQEILRIIECVAGEVDVLSSFAPRPEFAARAVRLRSRRGLGWECAYGRRLLLLRSDVHFTPGPDGFALTASRRLRAGQSVALSLTYSDEAPAVIPELGDAARARLVATLRFWRDWIRRCRHDGLYREHVRRSALVLKLLTFAPSGAIIAAPTTSLPELLGGGRNYDYRYCWLRDAAFTVRALMDLGFADEAQAFASWILHATNLTRPRLQILYSVYGNPRLPERTLDWLSGYADSRPVRVGNAAQKQFQLDVYGEAADAVFAALPLVGRIDSETRRFLIETARFVCKLWDQPDEGIWEPRYGRRHNTHSKALAWTALDRAARACKTYGWKAPVERFEKAAAAIRADIEARGYNAAIGAYTRAFGGDQLDASVLTMPLVGYCDAASPRMTSTYRAIAAGLSRKGLVYRYLREKAPDGLPAGEGSFGICNFWLAECWARAGNIEEAKRWFESVLKLANPVGLWPEEFDPETGAFLGNYPQGFTHIGLINAARAISNARGPK